MRKSCLIVLLLLASAGSLGMFGQGCVDPGLAELAGLWQIERTNTELFVQYSAANGGTVDQGGGGGALEPLDPNEFPPILLGVVRQWNAALDDLNAKLDAALPDQVVVTFPAPGLMHIADPQDPNAMGLGAIDGSDAYVFIGDLTGDGQGDMQGGGATLSGSSIDGVFDRSAQTTEGAIVRREVVALFGSSDNGLTITVEVRVHYTGRRIGDLP